MAETKEAIIGGYEDTFNEFPYVVRIYIPDPGNTGFGTGCSGTLVTPVWVLTARHCIVGEADDPLAINKMTYPVTVYGGPGGNTQVGTHTFNGNNPILLFGDLTAPVDPSNNDDVSTDVALIRLDTPIQYKTIVPLHPPFLAGDVPCVSGDQDFQATVVGYGNGDVGPWVGCPPTPGPLKRRFATFDDWSRDTETSGSYFEHFTTVCPFYAGTQRGDSGGLLVKTNTSDGRPRMCGVVSGVYHGAAWVEDDITAIDSPVTEDGIVSGRLTPYNWIRSHILDGRGYFEGECPKSYAHQKAPGSNTDTDNDGILDICDSCPLIANPEQATHNDDPDKNGLGAACDPCPGYKDAYADCNYEDELQLAWPGLPAPVLPILASDPNRDLWKAKFLSLKPDACDPTPCPRHETPYGGGSLPEWETPPDPAPATADCQIYGCSWSYDNRITLSPGVPPAPTGSPGAAVTVGIRWCDCEQADTTTLNGRVACTVQNEKPCVYDSDQYTLPQGCPLV